MQITFVKPFYVLNNTPWQWFKQKFRFFINLIIFDSLKFFLCWVNFLKEFKRLTIVKKIFFSFVLLISMSQVKKCYGLFPRTIFVWFFSFVITTLFPMCFITQKVSHSNMHIKRKNQNTKRRLKTKSIFLFL